MRRSLGSHVATLQEGHGQRHTCARSACCPLGPAVGFILCRTGFPYSAGRWPPTIPRFHKLELSPQTEDVSFPAWVGEIPVRSPVPCGVSGWWPGGRGCSGTLNTGAGAAGCSQRTRCSCQPFPSGAPGGDRLLSVTSGLYLPLLQSHMAKVALPLTELVGIGPGPGLEATEREPSRLDTCLHGLIFELRRGEDTALLEGPSGSPGEYPGSSDLKPTRGLMHASVRGPRTVRSKLFLRKV